MLTTVVQRNRMPWNCRKKCKSW